MKAVADRPVSASAIEPYAVTLSAANCELELYTKVFRVPTNFLPHKDPPRPEDGRPRAPVRPGQSRGVLGPPAFPSPRTGRGLLQGGNVDADRPNTLPTSQMVSRFVERDPQIGYAASRPVPQELARSWAPTVPRWCQGREQERGPRRDPTSGGRAPSRTTAPTMPRPTCGPTCTPVTPAWTRYRHRLYSNSPTKTRSGAVSSEAIVPECVGLEFLAETRGARLTWFSQTGRTLRIEVSSDLTTWIAAGAATELRPGVFELTDPSATGTGSRFYRAVVP